MSWCIFCRLFAVQVGLRSLRTLTPGELPDAALAIASSFDRPSTAPSTSLEPLQSVRALRRENKATASGGVDGGSASTHCRRPFVFASVAHVPPKSPVRPEHVAFPQPSASSPLDLDAAHVGDRFAAEDRPPRQQRKVVSFMYMQCTNLRTFG